MEAQLVHRHLGPGAQAALKAREYALDQAVEADGGEVFAVGLHAHPAVVIENISLFPVTVNDLHERPGLFGHEALGEIHIVPLVLRGRTVRGLQPAMVDEILGGQRVAVFPLEGPQRRRTDGKVVAAPVHEPAAAAHIAAEDPYEVIEQRGQTDHAGLRVVGAPFVQPVLQESPGERMPGIELPQMLAGPVVGGVVVHVDLFPDAPAQERDRIAMPRSAAAHGDPAVPVFPTAARDLGIRRAVPHLPVGQGFGRVVQLELLPEIPVQGGDNQGLALRERGLGAEEALLLGIGVLKGEGVVLPNDADGGIDAVARFQDLRGQLGSVAVAYHVGSPFFGQLQRQLFIARFAGQGEIPAQFLAHYGSLLLCAVFGIRCFLEEGRSLAAPAPGNAVDYFAVAGRWVVLPAS